MEFGVVTKGIRVVCDNPTCTWEQSEKRENLKLWHNKACPVCGQGPIISDKDLAMIDVMNQMLEEHAPTPSLLSDPKVRTIDVSIHSVDGELNVTRTKES